MNNENYNYKAITPFKWFVLENFPFIEADFDALTNWQLFCKLGKEMNKIIDAVNGMGIEVENIADYFENLNVQNEINNKLDEMADSGELLEIITGYLELNSILCFNTVSSMKSSENLINGSVAKTLGFHSKNDGGSAIYLVRTKTNSDVYDEKLLIELQNDLTGVLMIKNEMNVECFGAYGDNSHDDTSAITTALNNCNTVLFGSKTYKSSVIDINTSRFLTLIGNNTKIQYSRTNWLNLTNISKGTLLNNLYASNRLKGLVIKNILFDGNCSNAETDIAVTNQNFDLIDICNLDYFELSNCEVRNTYQGAIGTSGCLNTVIKNCYIHNIGKGAISTLILQRNAINVRGWYVDRNNNNNQVNVNNTQVNIENNEITDIVDEVCYVSNIKNFNMKENNIYNIGQYILELFPYQNEIKDYNILNNNINNTGSTIFNFNDTQQILGKISFNVKNNNIYGIGAFTTYRNSINGNHYITNVKDYARLIVHTNANDGSRIKSIFDGNKISLTEAPNTTTFIRCLHDLLFINNDFNLTSLTATFSSGNQNHETVFINNKIYASDTPATRYSLFTCYHKTIIIGNNFDIGVARDFFSLNTGDTLIQNNYIKGSLDVGNQYTCVIGNASANDNTRLNCNNNIITNLARCLNSSLSETRGTCLFTGNLVDVTTFGSNDKFTNILKVANYPDTINT